MCLSRWGHFRGKGADSLFNNHPPWREDSTLSEDTYTLVVSAHGGLILLAMDARSGELLTLRNVMSREVQPIRVVRVSKKDKSGNPVAIEFTNPAPHFW